MRVLVSMLIRSVVLVLAFAGLFAVNQRAARGDELLLSGTTTGTFNNASTQLLGLTYNSAVFSGTTSGGILVLDAVPNLPTNINNLGSFSLTVPPAPLDYLGGFTIQVMFNSPGGILGSNPSTFGATVFGNVFTQADGIVVIDFDNTPFVFSYATPFGVGAFSLAINDAFIDLGATTGAARSFAAAADVRTVTVPLTGTIRVVNSPGAAVPEPTTLLLLGTGLAGVAAKVSRRRKARGGTNA